MESNEERIVNSALELFVQNGCKRITMDQIATTVHISKRTLYETFNCKEDLLDACLIKLMDTIDTQRKNLSKTIDDPLLLALAMNQNHSLFCQRYDLLMHDTKTYYPEIFKKHFTITLEVVVQKIERWLEDAEKKGIIRPGANLKIAANTIVYFTEQIRKSDELKIATQNDINKEFIFTYIRGLLSEEYIIKYSQQENDFHKIIK